MVPEGQNDSRKTSLASAIIWAITGYRCRDQDGLHLETGVRVPVENDAGSKIGDWPSIASYPAASGLDTLRDLPDFGALEDAVLLSKEKLLAGDIPADFTNGDEEQVDAADDG